MKSIFSSEKGKSKIILALLTIVVLIAIISIVSRPLISLFDDFEKIRSFVNSFGKWSVPAFIFLQIVQVFIFPIPGQVAGLVSGYIFGPFYGTIYSMIGVTIGSYLAILISRKFGRPFVEKVINKDIMKKFDFLTEKKGTFSLFMIYLLPALPDDAICFIAGLTNIKIWKIVLISFIGRLPGFIVLNYAGGIIAVSRIEIAIGVIAVSVLLSLFIYLNRHRFEKYVERFKK
ncbi:TVP38/TMEM64 family protein [Candidatus Woesearchaeota archaeon]|nr:TVP38/TMEM64 family protein [Candidatus Woesearchaeota archaeon]